MKQRRRIDYTDAPKALMWDRWQKGESLAAIARLVDRGHSSIQGILAESGEIRPAPLPARPVRAAQAAGSAPCRCLCQAKQGDCLQRRRRQDV